MEKTNSYWIESTQQQKYPQPAKEVEVDVVIIGGGIVGITLAYLLKQEKNTVAVIENRSILKGVTGNTTAKVTAQHGLIYQELISTFGEEKARQYYDINSAAREFISMTCRKNRIDCDFEKVDSYVFASRKEDWKKLEKEQEAYERLRISGELLENLDLPVKSYGGICMKDQAQFHPMKYLIALAKKIPGKGSFLFENTRALDIAEDEEGISVKTASFSLRGQKAVVATHYPFMNKKGLYFARLYPMRSYVVAGKTRKKIPSGTYISTGDKYISFRTIPHGNQRLLLVGTGRHKTGHADEESEFRKLEKIAERDLGIQKIGYRWSTQDNHTPDNLPYIGNITKDMRNTFVATGFAGWGMTNGTAAALILNDLCQERENVYAQLYNPQRFKAGSAKKLIEENLHVGKEYAKSKFSRASADSGTKVKQGEGRIMEISGMKMAVYKDAKGKIHAFDPTCTHMGCHVRWNTAESSWDCPCHGSRFDPEGAVIHGPAVDDLKRFNLPE